MYYFPKIIFAGTPYFASCHLNALINKKYNIICVITKPDKPHGRNNKLIYNPVKQLAIIHKLNIYQPYSLNNHEVKEYIIKLKPDIIIVVAYGLILPANILSIPEFGCINVHCSLLPRWRGAAPIQRAILAGDIKTGITIIQMDSGIDTGEILHQTKCNITPYDTTYSLQKKLSIFGQDALITTLEKIIQKKNIQKQKQNNAQVKYAKKIEKSEAKINWYLSAIQIERCIRAFNPWPMSYFLLNNNIIKVCSANIINTSTTNITPGTITKINNSGINVTTGNGILQLTTLKLAGKQTMQTKEFIKSKNQWFIPGTILQ